MKRLLLLSCLAVVACSSGGKGSSQPAGGPGLPGPGAFITVAVSWEDEIEPNDSVAMSQALFIPSPSSSDEFVGFQVDGAVALQSDSMDTFAFTTNRTRTYTIELCESDCLLPLSGVSVDVAIAYFEILDQSGALLASSQGDRLGENYIEFDFDAGVPYHIMVRAEDTMSGTQFYSLIAIERFF